MCLCLVNVCAYVCVVCNLGVEFLGHRTRFYSAIEVKLLLKHYYISGIEAQR